MQKISLFHCSLDQSTERERYETGTIKCLTWTDAEGKQVNNDVDMILQFHFWVFI